jgi:hypothetical protein
MIERSWLVEATIGQMCAKSADVQNLHTRTGGVEKGAAKLNAYDAFRQANDRLGDFINGLR